jgi:hypothetical protein
MPHDVFISYSSNDQQAAMAVLHGLESEGIRCWMAPRDIRPGAIWAQAIMDAIAASRALVVVFTANANRSSHVLTEVDAAVRKGAVIVPFRIEDVMPDGAMAYHLRARHWLDALTPDLEDHVVRLADQIRTLLAAPATGPGTPPPRPMPEGFRQFRRKPPFRLRLPRVLRRRGVLPAAIAAVVLCGWYLSRDRAVRDATFTVREVSSGGGNESTLRVRATGVRFFESSNRTQPLDERQYRTTFHDDDTRYVQVELGLTYDAPGRVVQFPFACTVGREGAQIVTTLALTATIQPAWTESFHDTGWGNPTPGTWEPGRYRAECRYGDRLVARDWFTIEAGATAPSELERDLADDGSAAAVPSGGGGEASALDARIQGIRFFESGYGSTPQADRDYASTFRSSEARYINLEVTLSYPRTSASSRAVLACVYFRNGDEPIGTIELAYDIGPGETRRWSSGGWGEANPGYWTPGNYRVECSDGGALRREARFTVR